MALEIFRLVGSVFVDTDKAQKSLQKTDKNAEGLGSKLLAAGKKAGKFALAVGAAAVTAGTAIVALTETTREYRTEQAKLQTAFETQNFSAQAARKTYEALNGVLGDSGQAVEAASHLAQLASTEEELAKWTDICTGVYATFGDSLPIEGLTEAANETAKVGKVTGPLADALNWAGVAEDAFNASLAKCTTEQERAALITETLNGLYDEASDKYKELNADAIAANKAQDRLNAAMAKVGGALEPFVTKGKELVADVFEKVLPLIDTLANETLPWVTQKIEDFRQGVADAKAYISDAFQPALDNLKTLFGDIKDALQPFIDKLTEYVDSGELAEDATAAFKDTVDLLADGAEWVTEKLTAFADWCSNNTETIETIAIVIGSFAAAWAIVNTAMSIWTGVSTLATATTTALGAAVAFLTSPITIAIAIIGAIIAVGVLLWKNWDTIKAKAVELWQALVEKFQQIKDNISAKVAEIKENTVQKFQELKDGAVRWVTDLVAKAKEKFENIKSTISLAVSTAKQKVVDTFAGMYDSVVEKVSNIYSKVKEKFDAVKQAISDAIEAAKQKVSDVIDGIKDLFDFDFKLNLKLPHIKVDGGEAPWGIGGAGKLPSFDVEWYKKGMDEAMLLNDPTIFGYQGGKFLGGGEAGREVVVGEAHLLDMMAKVVANQTAARDEQIVELLVSILEAIGAGNSDLLRAIRAGHVLKVGEREFKRMVREFA